MLYISVQLYIYVRKCIHFFGKVYEYSKKMSLFGVYTNVTFSKPIFKLILHCLCLFAQTQAVLGKINNKNSKFSTVRFTKTPESEVLLFCTDLWTNSHSGDKNETKRGYGVNNVVARGEVFVNNNW